MFSGGSGTSVTCLISSSDRPLFFSQVSITASAFAPRVLTATFLPTRSCASLIDDPASVTIPELIVSLDPYVDTTALIGAPVATSWAIEPKKHEALMSIWWLVSAWTLCGPPVTSPTFFRVRPSR